MANIGKWQITNETYQDIETIIGQSLTGTAYQIQVEGGFYMCEKGTQPDELEGYHFRAPEKTFKYFPKTSSLYLKKDYPYEITTVNVDEIDE